MTFYNTLRIIVWPQEVVEVAKFLQEKFSKCFLESKINFYSWEKKTKIKVHLQNFWSQKGSAKQKCSSGNFGIRIYLWNVIVFKKEQGFWKKNEMKSIKKCIFYFIVLNCGKIQGQFVIQILKTEITMVSYLMSMLV